MQQARANGIWETRSDSGTKDKDKRLYCITYSIYTVRAVSIFTKTEIIKANNESAIPNKS